MKTTNAFYILLDTALKNYENNGNAIPFYYFEAKETLQDYFYDLKGNEDKKNNHNLLDDMQYHIDTIDEEGFSNYKIKELLKEIIKEIKKGL